MLAASTTENLSQHEPAVSSMCPISIYCPRSGKDGASCGKQEPAPLVLAGPSFTTQVLPSATVQSVSPKPAGSSGKRWEEVLQCRMPARPWKGGGWLPRSSREEACANTQQTALLRALSTAQPQHGLVHPLMAPCTRLLVPVLDTN